MDFRSKLLDEQSLPEWRATQRNAGRRVVVTNGCFDLLHLGHVTYLQSARQQGDLLLVGVNSDAAVRKLKGEQRPITPEQDRSLVLAALESVDAVFIFDDASAAGFLSQAKPDIYVKGGDYTLETLNQTERRVVEDNGGRIVLIPFVPGRSTTSTLEKIARL